MFVPNVNLASNPGDYAWGRGGLDAIITQLMNQLDGTGPPPLSGDQIQQIPTVGITKEQTGKLSSLGVSNNLKLFFLEDVVCFENKLHGVFLTEAGLQCSVCMEDFTKDESVRKLNCDHHYHSDCIIPWLELVCIYSHVIPTDFNKS